MWVVRPFEAPNDITMYLFCPVILFLMRKGLGRGQVKPSRNKILSDQEKETKKIESFTSHRPLTSSSGFSSIQPKNPLAFPSLP